MEHNLLLDIVILLFTTVITVVVCRRIQLPPILGYLFVGVVVGPFAMGWVNSEESIHFLAEMGIVFLMFSIGLEFSIPQFMAMRKTVLGIGGLQVTLTGVILGSIGMALGLDWIIAFILGFAMALSSTAVVTKQLAEQSELHSRHGRSALGVLIFQDLAVIPLLILIPALGAQTGNIGSDLGMALINGIIAIAVMLFVGRWILRPVFHEIASAKSPEVFTLATLLVTLAAAAVTYELGLSMALGAFVAGMMLSETEYRHQIENDIRPFKDVLLGLFFITVGMLIDPQVILSQPLAILAVAVTLIVLKLIVTFGIMRLFKHKLGVSARTSIVLAHAGEFGFALVSLILAQNLIQVELAQTLLAGAVLSMAFSPIMIRFNGRWAKQLFKSYKKERSNAADNISLSAFGLDDHVIICGYGRVGQNISRFLDDSEIPFAALDLDPKRVSEASHGGEHVYFGDATQEEILKALNISKAKLVVISFSDFHLSLKILQAVRKVRPEIPVLVRTQDDSKLNELLDAGATEVIPETLEASIMLASHVLLLSGVSSAKILKKVRQVRQTRYQMLDGFYPGEIDTPELTATQSIIHSLTITETSTIVGQTVESLKLHEFNVELIAINRGGIRGKKPTPDAVVKANDVLVISGQPEHIEHLENTIAAY